MSYKILFCEPGLEKTEASPYWDWWKKIADTVLSSDIVLEFGGLRKACMGLSTFDQSYNGVQMAQRAYEAEKQGYDAFIIGCASDMGLKECRGIVNIPVIAPTEATALYASTLGTKFSIIDLQPFTKPSIENVVANAGLLEKLASVRCPPGLTAKKAMEMTFGSDKYNLIKMLTDEMSKAVIEDGAEALFVSCTITSAFITTQGIYAVEGAPVVDQTAACLKMAESLLGFKKSYNVGVCKRSIYIPPSESTTRFLSQAIPT